MRLWAVLFGALALSAAAPPGWFSGSEVLVVAGLGALYSLCEGSNRPRLAAYLFGICHVLAFSWSLHHVHWVGYLGVGLVAGLYFPCAVAWSRALTGLGSWVSGPLAFGCALAASTWLRAELPEVAYPHAQPIHALYRWPALLGPVALGGEVLGNALLGAFAAAIVDVWRAWRVARPEWGAAWRMLAGVVLAWAGTVVVYHGALAPGRESEPETLSLAAIEPGFDSSFRSGARWLDRLMPPTLRVAGEDAANPPRLVLWPESCFPFRLRETPQGASLEAPAQLGLSRGTALLAGTDIDRNDGHWSAISLLLGASGKVLGWQEKEHVVPGGERLPFLTWLPAGVREALLAKFRETMRFAPDLEPGRPRAPLQLPDGRGGHVALGAMLCYDNAYPGLARRLVGAGARLLVVLSNESWYRGGAELDQLLAMSVMRCLETACPLVRCTVDGHTVALDARGRVRSRIEPGASRAAPKVLEIDMPLGTGRLPPLAWLHAAVVLLVLATGLAWVRHVLLSWARLLVARTLRSDQVRPGRDAKDGSVTSP